MARAIVKFSLNTPKGQAALSNARRVAARERWKPTGYFMALGREVVEDIG